MTEYFGAELHFNTWVVWLMGLTLIANIIGFILIYIGLLSSTKQQKAEIFLRCSEKYEEICEKHFNLISEYPYKEKHSITENETYNEFLPKYVSLLQQEFFLQKVGLVDEEVWRLWVSYLRKDAQTNAFKLFWKKERGQNDGDPKFVKFMDEMTK